MSGLLSALGYLQVAALGRLGETEARTVFYFSLCCAFGGAAMTALGGWPALLGPGLGWLLAVGVLGTVAQLLLTRAYARGSPLVTASLQYTGIAFSFLAGVVIFDDAVSGLALAGIALIVGAAIRATQLRQAKAHATRS
jgi:S-adenosylmethionine uptake transporter